MRIARVLTRLNLGGPARQVLATDPLLAGRGHQVRVFAGKPGPGEGDLFDVLLERGIDVVRIPGLSRRLGPGDLFAAGSLRRALQAFGPDLVHTHASKAGTLGRRAARRLPGVRTVHTFHGHVLEGYFPPQLSRLLIRVEAGLASRTDQVVAVSQATADDLVRLGVVPPGRLAVVPPGIDLAPLLAIRGRSNRLRQLVGAEEQALLVGVVGRLAWIKAPEVALKVFDQLCGRYPHVHLCFVGDGGQRRLLESLVRRGREDLRRRVHLVGAQPNMVDVMADLDIVLSTSRSEGMPVALIEAAAAGLPVVATPVGGVPELVAHGLTGFLGEGADELGVRLSKLLDEQQLRSEMGLRARRGVSERHSAAALTDRLEELYRGLVEEVPCAS